MLKSEQTGDRAKAEIVIEPGHDGLSHQRKKDLQTPEFSGTFTKDSYRLQVRKKNTLRCNNSKRTPDPLLSSLYTIMPFMSQCDNFMVYFPNKETGMKVDSVNHR